MNRRAPCIKLIVIISLACAATSLRAQDGLEGALSRASVAQLLRTKLVGLFEQRLAAADFDNDHKPDGAILLNSVLLHNRNTFRIEVHLSASTNTELTFESSENALSITALDINRDGRTDVIVEQPLTHRRLHVWLGDGRGGFRKGRVEDFPSNGALAGQEASTPRPDDQSPVLSFPSQRRFQPTLLKTSHILGRPPSAQEFRLSLEVVNRSSRVIALLSSRSPPLA